MNFAITMNCYTVVAIIVLSCFTVEPAKSASKKQQNDAPACLLTIQTDLPKSCDPLLLVQSSKGTTLVYPIGEDKLGKIVLRADEKLLVACPGKQNKENTVTINSKNVAVVTCSRQEKLEVEGKEVTAPDLQCEYPISPELRITKDTCGGGVGTLLQLGYTVLSEWYNIIDVCHNINEANTYFVTHQLHGSALAGAIISSERKPFMVGPNELYKNFSPDADYKQEKQGQLFNMVLGGNLGDFVYNSETFLARGHMCPDADQIYKQEQLLTYYYVNTAPQWQVINAGNWLKVEKNVRKLAIQLNTTLAITTGTKGVLTLPDINKKMKEIYFEPVTKRLRVPELVWKLVVNPDDGTCIVFVSINNPFIDSAPQTVCKDITKTSGWPQLQDNYATGYIYHCEYNDFKKAVPYVPNYTCQSVLQWPFSTTSKNASNKKRKAKTR